MVIVEYINQHYEPVGFTGKVFIYKAAMFYKNNLLHRIYGPASIQKYNDRCEKSYYFNSKLMGSETIIKENYSFSQYKKDISKLWLL